MLSNKPYVFLVSIILLLCSAGYFFSLTLSNNQQVSIRLLWQEKELGCKTPFNAGEENKIWFIEQFQFFISDIHFGSEKLGWQKVNLAANPYQANDTVLLGTNCRKHSQEATSGNGDNWSIEFESTAKAIVNENNRIRFTLGVPFAVNHLNPISQKSPLNLPSMFWVWQTGHKFMRLELATNNHQWLFHLGSTGCQSASVMRAPELACRYPNTMTVELPITQHSDDNLVLGLDLAALLSNVELTSSSSCQSEHDNVNCQQLFNNLSITANNKGAITESSIFKLVKLNNISKGGDVE